jgi:hypothetical protein
MADKTVTYETRGERAKKAKAKRGKVVTYDKGEKPDPKYKNSKFNPFADGGKSAGNRIKGASGSNSPAEDDSDFDPKKHGNASVKARALQARIRKFKANR